MKIATWNVNGIRARQSQLFDWLAAEQPDIVCLQEIKASLDQLTFELRDMEGYWSYWHGDKGYSGVAVLVKKSLVGALPICSHPTFDFEQRIVCASVPLAPRSLGEGGSPAGDVMIASVYVPNGGKDFDAKMRFLEALESFVAEAERDQKLIILCGDLNVALAERDIHPKLQKPNQIGARPEERALLARIISRGLVDVHRSFEPDNDNLFTWWAPWRNQKERNIGWRIDYVLASKAIAERAASATVQREIGSSDHGPVVVNFNFG
ncbi:MAG TPA: exodeoxyribonuclease III [Vicinamibacterales bacterium]|nr:exodeoxyribonuclease III [Vicinamibacterales bacterium]